MAARRLHIQANSHIRLSPFIHSHARYLACWQKFLPVRELEPVRVTDDKFREPFRHVRELAQFAYGTEHTRILSQTGIAGLPSQTLEKI